MSREKQRFVYKKYWTNVAEMIREGKEKAYLRGELADIPANQLEIPDRVPLYIAKDREPKDEYSLYAAIIEVNGKQAIVATGRTREQVRDYVFFDMVYSHYAPSNYYRVFRSLMGYSFNTIDEYTTPELRKKSEEKMFKAMAVMAGVNINKLNSVKE